MNLLLTNDDGLSSPGLWALYHQLKRNHRVTVIAPDQDRSGCSHSFSLKTPIRIKSLKPNIHCCYGTPSDCVFAGIHHVMDTPPDMVLSGINPGPNLGTDIVYSGTAAGAREAALRGIPGMALSVGNRKAPFHFDRVTHFLERHFAALVDLWRPGTFININFPDGENNPVEDTLVLCRPGKREYHDRITVQHNSSGERFLFIHGDAITSEEDPETDTGRVANGQTAVSLISIHPVSEEGL